MLLAEMLLHQVQELLGVQLGCGGHTLALGVNQVRADAVECRLEEEVQHAVKVGFDLLLARHFSVGFRWNGMGNVAAYESVPVAWDQYGNVTRYEQRTTQSDEFSLGFFTLIAGIRF